MSEPTEAFEFEGIIADVFVDPEQREKLIRAQSALTESITGLLRNNSADLGQESYTNVDIPLHDEWGLFPIVHIYGEDIAHNVLHGTFRPEEHAIETLITFVEKSTNVNNPRFIGFTIDSLARTNIQDEEDTINTILRIIEMARYEYMGHDSPYLADANKQGTIGLLTSIDDMLESNGHPLNAAIVRKNLLSFLEAADIPIKHRMILSKRSVEDPNIAKIDVQLIEHTSLSTNLRVSPETISVEIDGEDASKFDIDEEPVREEYLCMNARCAGALFGLEADFVQVEYVQYHDSDWYIEITTDFETNNLQILYVEADEQDTELGHNAIAAFEALVQAVDQFKN